MLILEDDQRFRQILSGFPRRAGLRGYGAGGEVVVIPMVGKFEVPSAGLTGMCQPDPAPHAAGLCPASGFARQCCR
jgi:hypothetical protein